MFYLILFFRIIKSYPLKGMLLLLFSLLIILSFIQKSYFESKVFRSLSEVVHKPHFYALLSGKENIAKISRKLSNLPGVYEISVLPRENIQQSVHDILGDLDVGMGVGNFNTNFVGLKVVFDEGLQSRSKNLIREYLVRLVGKDSVTLGAISSDDEYSRRKYQMLSLWKIWGSWIFIIVLALIWLVVFIDFGKKTKEKSYLIEQYQRRTNVGSKTTIIGLFFTFAIMIGLALSFGQPEFFNISFLGVLCLIGLILHSRKYVWTN